MSTAADATPQVSLHSSPLTVSTPPPLTSLSTLSAAAEVYNLPELRCRILRLLPRKDLVRFLVVDKRNMFEIAREVYRVVEYKQMRRLLQVAPERIRVYSAAVSEVHARRDHMPRDMNLHKQLGVTKEKKKKTRVAGHNPIMFRLLVMKIRNQCGNTRRIRYTDGGQGAGGGDCWVVTFDSDREGSDALGPDAAEDSGHIRHIRNLYREISSRPAASLAAPPPPSPHYTVSIRFDLYLSPSIREVPGPPLLDEWLLAVRTAPMFNQVYQSLVLHHLPVTLGDLTNLYRRQIEYGHRERLQLVCAGTVEPFGVRDFETFARVASTSLTTLNLSNGERRLGDQVTLSFDDLPALCQIVRDHLRNLTELDVNVKGISTAEQLCGTWLTGESLSEKGTLYSLTILTDDHEGPVYNILRYLYSICAAEPYVCVTGDPHQPRWVAEEQSGFIQFLQRHLSHLRAKLATVDFPSLGITSLEEVPELLFDEDDNLLNLTDSRAARPRSPGSWSPSQCECGHSDCGSTNDCCTANPADYETYGYSSPARYEDYEHGYGEDDWEED